MKHDGCSTSKRINFSCKPLTTKSYIILIYKRGKLDSHFVDLSSSAKPERTENLKHRQIYHSIMRATQPWIFKSTTDCQTYKLHNIHLINGVSYNTEPKLRNKLMHQKLVSTPENVSRKTLRYVGLLQISDSRFGKIGKKRRACKKVAPLFY